MTRIRRIFIAFLCVLMLTTVVFADSGANKVDTRATVSSNGTCHVTMTVVINMESPASGLTFRCPGAQRMWPSTALPPVLIAAPTTPMWY